MMAIDNIITMILVNGLPDEFKYMKDLMFSKETLKAMMTYDLNKQKVDVLPTLAVPPGPTIMSAATRVYAKICCAFKFALSNFRFQKKKTCMRNFTSLGNGSYKKVCGFCTFVHTMWKGTKLHRGFTSDVHSYKNNICNILSPHYK
jgi:hypothetical protein